MKEGSTGSNASSAPPRNTGMGRRPDVRQPQAPRREKPVGVLMRRDPIGDP